MKLPNAVRILFHKPMTELKHNQFNTTMNKLQLKGTWNEAKGKLKQKYAQLTDDDLIFLEGKEDELVGRLQTRLGKTKEEVMREIKSY